VTGYIVSLFLPWLLGAVLLRRVWHAGNLPAVLGYGYLVGILTVTLFLRMWDWAGIDFQFWAIVAVMLLVGLPLVVMSKDGGRIQMSISRPKIGLTRAGLAAMCTREHCLFVVFFLLIVVRFGTILEDNLVRPLFAWDAWMNWAPKARVWFELKELAPFVDPASWLDGGSSVGAYTLANSTANDYPITVPLIMLWTALGLDAWSDDLIKLPWVMCAVALGFGVYGQFRHFGISRHLSMVLVYLLLSVPYLNIHITLAGYAEIWLATALCLGVLALLHWIDSGDRSSLLLAILFALFCMLIKKPGIIWGGVLLLSIVSGFLPRWLVVAAAGVVIAVFSSIWIVDGGIDVTLPLLGQLQATPKIVSIPYFGTHDFGFTNISAVVIESLFLSPNWSLFWYAASALTLLALATRPARLLTVAPFVFILTSAAVFFFIFYMIPSYSRLAPTLVTFNRALLHLVPAVFVFLVWWFWGTASVRRLGSAPNRAER